MVLVSILLIIFCSSCDQRTSKKERLETAVSEFNKKLELKTSKAYYPEGFVEIQTDSIISDTFAVSIKNYTNMHSEIGVLKGTSSQNEKNLNYRKFESDIKVSVNNGLIFERHVSADNFEQNQGLDFWQDATLEHIWVNQDQSTKERLSLNISIINPKLNTFKLFEMRIDKNGKETINLIEETT